MWPLYKLLSFPRMIHSKAKREGKRKKESGEPKIETSVLINDSCFKVIRHSFFHIASVAWTHCPAHCRQELHQESGPLGSSAAASLRQWRPILVPCNAQTIRPAAWGSHRGWETYFPKGKWMSTKSEYQSETQYIPHSRGDWVSSRKWNTMVHFCLWDHHLFLKHLIYCGMKLLLSILIWAKVFTSNSNVNL